MRVAILNDIHDVYQQTSGVRPFARPHWLHQSENFYRPIWNTDALRRFDALIANRERTRFSRDLLEQLPDLKIIANREPRLSHRPRSGGATRHRRGERPATVFCTGAGELAIGLAIALMRQIPTADAAIKSGRWPTPVGRELHGKTMGIVGLGHVGHHVAAMAKAIGMRVISRGAGARTRMSPRHWASNRLSLTIFWAGPTLFPCMLRSRRKRATCFTLADFGS